jgi:hypothetical protein
MNEKEKAIDFIYGIFVAIVGSLLVSSIIEFDNAVFGNWSSLVIGYWNFMFILSSFAFFQVSKIIIKKYGVKKSTLRAFDIGTIVCILIGIYVMAWDIIVVRVLSHK